MFSVDKSRAYLETLLASLDGGNVSGNTATNDNEVLLLCAKALLACCRIARGNQYISIPEGVA